MSNLTSEQLLEQSLALTNKELKCLQEDFERIESEFRTKAEPLKRKIECLEAVAAHLTRAVEAINEISISDSRIYLRESGLAYAPASSEKITDVLERILLENGAPMHYTVLSEEAVRRGSATSVQDPGAYVINYLRREPDRFCRTDPGVYALIAWNLPGSRRLDEKRKPAKRTKSRSRSTKRSNR